MDGGGGLGVVEVESYGDLGGARGGSGGLREEGVGVVLGPGKEEDHGGGAFGGGGADGGEDAFEVVLGAGELAGGKGWWVGGGDRDAEAGETVVWEEGWRVGLKVGEKRVL